MLRAGGEVFWALDDAGGSVVRRSGCSRAMLRRLFWEKSHQKVPYFAFSYVMGCLGRHPWSCMAFNTQYLPLGLVVQIPLSLSLFSSEKRKRLLVTDLRIFEPSCLSILRVSSSAKLLWPKAGLKSCYVWRLQSIQSRTERITSCSLPAC